MPLFIRQSSRATFQTCCLATAVGLFIAVLSLPTHADNLPDIGNSADSLISPEDEKMLGREFMRSVRRSLKLVDDPISTEYIRDLGESLASQIDTRGQTLNFFIVDDNTINAFAGPAGHIGIHSGLINEAGTEGELASVVAHEIAHVIQRHLVRSFESSKNLSIAAMAAIMAAILLGSGNGQIGEAVLASTIAGTTQRQLSFSRTNEQEADRVGIDMLASAGFNPNSMADFFETLQYKSRFSGHNVPEFLLTHPVTTTRIADSRGRAASLLPTNHSNRPLNSIRYQLIRARLQVLNHRQPELETSTAILAANLKKRETPDFPGQYELALRYSKLGKHTKAQDLLENLIKTDRLRIVYVIALAQNDIKALRYASAINILAETLRLYPENLPLTWLYADVLLLDGQAKNAMQALQQQIRSHPDTPEIYKTFAMAAQQAGFAGDAYESLANYYYEYGEINTSIKHLEEALQQPNIDEYRALKFKARLKELKQEVVNKHATKKKP
ncbi:MAG: M48 family metallopeptidase [Gammaproteobacteria bacterium]|nr:M48 family metallopeptidase [Gammaproteobacteria bacterium]